jgi:hypothetical protein
MVTICNINPKKLRCGDALLKPAFNLLLCNLKAFLRPVIAPKLSLILILAGIPRTKTNCKTPANSQAFIPCAMVAAQYY